MPYVINVRRFYLPTLHKRYTKEGIYLQTDTKI
jgi:hypothetical protein